MKETRLASFVQNEVPRRDVGEVSEISVQILENFRLQEGIPDIRPEEESRMALAIAESVVDCTNFFQIPFPVVTLLYDWGDEEGREKYKRAAAKADFDPKHPLGEIGFSPQYLIDFFASMRGFKGYLFHPVKSAHGNPIIETTPMSPRYLAGHETYHLHQARKYPRLFASHAAIALEKAATGEWSKLRFDRAAQRFGSLYFTEVYRLLSPVEASQMLDSLSMTELIPPTEVDLEEEEESRIIEEKLQGEIETIYIS